MKWTKEEIEHFDLRNSVIHEAGHMVVARAKGISASIEVWPADSVDLMKTKAWRARVRLSTLEIPAEIEAVICLAGPLAEYLLTQEDPDWNAGSCYEFIEDGLVAEEISQSDAQGMGDIWEDHLEETIDLIREHKDEILTEAERVITQNEVALGS